MQVWCVKQIYGSSPGTFTRDVGNCDDAAGDAGLGGAIAGRARRAALEI